MLRLLDHSDYSNTTSVVGLQILPKFKLMTGDSKKDLLDNMRANFDL